MQLRLIELTPLPNALHHPSAVLRCTVLLRYYLVFIAVHNRCRNYADISDRFGQWAVTLVHGFLAIILYVSRKPARSFTVVHHRGIDATDALQTRLSSARSFLFALCSLLFALSSLLFALCCRQRAKR